MRLVRVFYSGPRILRLAIPVTLFGWILLSGYLVLYAGPPLAVGILLLIPILVLVWVASASARGVSWEADLIGYSFRRGDRLSQLVRWQDVKALLVAGTHRSSTASMAIVDTAGKTRVKLVTSYALGLDDIRILYEASAYYLRDFGVYGKNNLGWHPSLPTSGTHAAIGERPRILPYVAESLFVAGLSISVTGSLYGGLAAPASFGVGLIGIALAIFAVTKLRLRKPGVRTDDGQR